MVIVVRNAFRLLCMWHENILPFWSSENSKCAQYKSLFTECSVQFSRFIDSNIIEYVDTYFWNYGKKGRHCVCVYGKHSLTKGLCFVRVRIETAIRTKERERENKRWDRVHNAVDMPYHKHKSLTYKPVFRCNEYEMYTIFRIKFSHAHSRIHTRIHTIVVV